MPGSKSHTSMMITLHTDAHALFSKKNSTAGGCTSEEGARATGEGRGCLFVVELGYGLL